jgi:hypothetical protein
MHRLNHKARGSIAAWVAIVVVALNALWPLIAQFKPDAMAAMQMEACAEAGMHHAAEDGQNSAPSEPSPLMPQCAFCTLAAGGFAVLVADNFDAAPLIIDTMEFRPASPEVRPLAVFSYPPAHPRAPPVIS